MNITVIGAGSMARGIGTRLVVGGNSVTLIDQKPGKSASLAAELSKVAAGGATAQSVPEKSTISDPVVILALPYPEVAKAVSDYRNQLALKIIVDITNPLNNTYDGLATPPGTSAAEEIQKIAPKNAKVVKAFNTTFAGTLVAGEVDGKPLDVFIAGDDAGAKNVISELVTQGKLRPIDAGPLKRARELEAIGFLGIQLQGTLGTKFMSAWKLLS